MPAAPKMLQVRAPNPPVRNFVHGKRITKKDVRPHGSCLSCFPIWVNPPPSDHHEVTEFRMDEDVVRSFHLLMLQLYQLVRVADALILWTGEQTEV